MTPTRVRWLYALLLLLLLGNVCAWVWLFRGPSPSTAADAGRSIVSIKREVTTGSLSAAQLAALKSGDVAALEAAGFPPEAASQLAAGRAFTRWLGRVRELKAQWQPKPYWKTPAFEWDGPHWAEINRAQLDLSSELRAALGADLTMAHQPQLSYLPAAKQELLRRIDQDYTEMMSDVYRSMGGVSLPADEEKLKVLQQERKRDIDAALTAEERELYELHDSQTALNLRSMFGQGFQSEADYRKVFALQKAFDDRYADVRAAGQPPPPEFWKERSEAEAKLHTDILNAVGQPAFDALRQATDNDYKTLTALQKRMSLGSDVTTAVQRSRDQYAALSQQINRDPSLTAPQRQERLRELANQAGTELTALLGKDAAAVYKERSTWLNVLRSGSAFSTNPSDAPGGRLNFGQTIFATPPRG